MAKKNVSPFEYKEKIWGKDEGGEHIIDGYTFRGKRAFGKAQEGLKEYMRKGVVRDVNEVKIKVLDARENGAGIDIEIEMTETMPGALLYLNCMSRIRLMNMLLPSIKARKVNISMLKYLLKRLSNPS